MKAKLFFRIATGLFTLLMLFSATMYLVQHEMVSEIFLKLGFPTFIIYPLAAAKYLGLIAIWSDKFKRVTEWAYAGFTFDLILAFGAHVNISDGEQFGALIGLCLVAASYFFRMKVQEVEEETLSPSQA